MNKGFAFIALILLLIGTISVAFISKYTQEIKLTYPVSWPKPVFDFNENPLTEEGFLLGRKLFYDPKLSLDSTISCASCHLQFTAFTHVDHAVSHGIDGKIGTRNSPVLINLAWNSNFHWDGGVTNLTLQGINPIEHPLEMGFSLKGVLERLNSDSQYRMAFMQVYGDSVITTKRLLGALTQYTVSLVSANSKYDQVKNGSAEFSPQEQKGYDLFKSNCVACHKEPLFTTQSFESNGLPMDTVFKDLGRYGITQNPKDSLKFKVPTLRNVQFSHPYMHDGRFKKLSEVLNHYANHIDVKSETLSLALRHKLKLSSNDQKDIIAFLYTLTDKEFLYNPRFRPPIP